VKVDVPAPSGNIIYVPVPVPVPMPGPVREIFIKEDGSQATPTPPPVSATAATHKKSASHVVNKTTGGTPKNKVDPNDPALKAAQAAFRVAESKQHVAKKAVKPAFINTTGFTDTTGQSTPDEEKGPGKKVFSQSLQAEVFIQKGDQGRAGAAGYLGPPGGIGEAGAPGPQGFKGQPGLAGADGEDGDYIPPPGRLPKFIDPKRLSEVQMSLYVSVGIVFFLTVCCGSRTPSAKPR
jgi:hypothetical protein